MESRPITATLENLDAQEKLLVPYAVKKLSTFDKCEDDQVLTVEVIGTIVDIRDRRKQIRKRAFVCPEAELNYHFEF